LEFCASVGFIHKVYDARKAELSVITSERRNKKRLSVIITDEEKRYGAVF